MKNPISIEESQAFFRKAELQQMMETVRIALLSGARNLQRDNDDPCGIEMVSTVIPNTNDGFDIMVGFGPFENRQWITLNSKGR